MASPLARPFTRRIAMLGAGLAAALFIAARAVAGPAAGSAELPDPTLDQPAAASAGQQVAIFAGGCFWGVEAVFQHVKGVVSATSGYAGGTANTATYDKVSSGSTRHAEAVRVVFDSSKVTYGQLLKIFFSVVHDPTQLNRQGPDVGAHYRSAIWYTSAAQREMAESYIKQLDKAKVFKAPIVTEVAPYSAFYEAEAYHQDYFNKHPNQPYIVIHDRPKVEALKKQFAELYQ